MTETKRQLGTPRSKWADNIKMDLQETLWSMDWVDLAEDRDKWRELVDMQTSLLIPQNARNFLTS